MDFDNLSDLKRQVVDQVLCDGTHLIISQHWATEMQTSSINTNYSSHIEFTDTIGVDSWPARLPMTFEKNGLVEIVADNRPLRKEILQYQLDTALMASEEISRTAIDPSGDGKSDRTRELIGKVFADRPNTAFNVSRLTVVGRRPL